MNTFSTLSAEQQITELVSEFTTHMDAWLQAPWKKQGHKLELQYGKTKVSLVRAEVSGAFPVSCFYLSATVSNVVYKLTVDPAFVELQGTGILKMLTEPHTHLNRLWQAKAMPKPYDYFEL